jgi:hypothetical protein
LTSISAELQLPDPDVDACDIVALTSSSAELQLPVGQEHEEAPAYDILPLGQLEQEVALVPPVPEKYLPAAHAVHNDLTCRTSDSYRPAGHEMQPVPDLYWPLPQMVVTQPLMLTVYKP